MDVLRKEIVQMIIQYAIKDLADIIKVELLLNQKIQDILKIQINHQIKTKEQFPKQILELNDNLKSIQFKIYQVIGPNVQIYSPYHRLVLQENQIMKKVDVKLLNFTKLKDVISKSITEFLKYELSCDFAQRNNEQLRNQSDRVHKTITEFISDPDISPILEYQDESEFKEYQIQKYDEDHYQAQICCNDGQFKDAKQFQEQNQFRRVIEGQGKIQWNNCIFWRNEQIIDDKIAVKLDKTNFIKKQGFNIVSQDGKMNKIKSTFIINIKPGMTGYLDTGKTLEVSRNNNMETKKQGEICIKILKDNSVTAYIDYDKKKQNFCSQYNFQWSKESNEDEDDFEENFIAEED